jgi:predicted small metal-binding protein
LQKHWAIGGLFDLQGDRTMAKIIQCDCGYIVRGKTDDELVENAQKHAREVHNLDITREQALAMAKPELKAD